MSVSARKRGRDQSMTAGVASSVEDFRYESKRLREWLEFQEEYLLNQSDEFNEEEVPANSDRLLEIIRSLQEEIGIPFQSAPAVEVYASSQVLPFHIRPEEDALALSEKADSNPTFNCHTWDLKASKTREITLLRRRAGKQSLIRAQKLQDEVKRSAGSGAK